jgi:hypothetical protein
MFYFSENAFILGILGMFAMHSGTTISVIILTLFKIKVSELTVMLSMGPGLWKKKIGSVTYKLGWLPLGGGIRWQKAEESDTDTTEKKREDLWTDGIDHLSFIIITFITICLFYNFDIAGGIVKIFTYVGHLWKAMFSSKEVKVLLGIETLGMFDKASVSLFVLTATLAFLLPIALMLLLSKFVPGSKTREYLQVVVALIAAALYFWKIPSLLLLFFSFKQLINYLLNFLVGGFLAGLLIYVIVILIASIHHALLRKKEVELNR